MLHIRRLIALLSILLLPASVAWAQITVAANVQVSKARAGFGHGENMFSASPTDPNHLVGCSHVYYPTSNRGNEIIVYVSRDGGKTWAVALDSIPRSAANTDGEGAHGDPACVVGLGGAVLVYGQGDAGYIYRSADGGTTWPAKAAVLPTSANGKGSVDRGYVIADNTSSPYRGRIYVNAFQGSFTTQRTDPFTSHFSLWTSRDSGVSFGLPARRTSLPPRMMLPPHKFAVSGDGTLIGVFPEFDSREEQSRHDDCGGGNRPNATIKVVTAADGGENLTDPVAVSSACFHPGPNRVSYYLAVDTSSGSFRDRIYVVWADGRTGREEILLSYSADRGKTWSPPTVLGADGPAARTREGWRRDNFHPRVAVNKDGVVGVVWFDRRGLPDNVGYHQRFTASLDGGETWLPSVQVSEQPSAWDKAQQYLFWGDGSVHPHNFNGGDTHGFDADAAGRFHPLWIDNRTGILQLWTAAVTVAGRATRHGDPALASYTALTGRATLQRGEFIYDRARGLLMLTVRLENTSKDTLRGPIKARVTRLGSAWGTPEVANADTGPAGPGAVFDLSPLLPPTGLPPGAVSRPKRLVFKLTHVKPMAEIERVEDVLLLETTLLGPSPAR